MNRTALGLFVLICSLATVLQAGEATEKTAVQVMVLGTYHMGNPGQDVNNLKADDVTAPKRQAELADLCKRLSAFRPTAILVERVAPDQQTLVDPTYETFTPALLQTKPNEVIQVGHRLAHQLGINRVYAIDEQAAAGEPGYFPYELVSQWVEAQHRESDFEANNAPIKKMMGEFEAMQATKTVTELVRQHNQGLSMKADWYYGLLRFGKGRDLPGAELNGRWYTRNAKIFAKITQVAKPGDRLLVIYGSGHNFWLKHFAENTPGFRFVSPLSFLN